MISCTSEKYRRAYGWQRDGGMADYLLAEEKDLISCRMNSPTRTVRRWPAVLELFTKVYRGWGSAEPIPC